MRLGRPLAAASVMAAAIGASLAASPALAGDSLAFKFAEDQQVIVNPSDTAFSVSGTGCTGKDAAVGIALHTSKGEMSTIVKATPDAEGNWSTTLNIPELVKALQTARIHHSISFILGSAIQFLPQAHDITRRMRDACRLTGRTPHPGNLVIPVLVQVLYHGGQRATAMTTMGLELPGRRTVLRPPPDSPIQKLVRILLPLAAITLVVTV